eukprot:165658-Pleurochrysis_carterae.AAC.2
MDAKKPRLSTLEPRKPAPSLTWPFKTSCPYTRWQAMTTFLSSSRLRPSYGDAFVHSSATGVFSTDEFHHYVLLSHVNAFLTMSASCSQLGPRRFRSLSARPPLRLRPSRRRSDRGYAFPGERRSASPLPSIPSTRLQTVEGV